MKKILKVLLVLILFIGVTGCDSLDEPYHDKSEDDLDTADDKGVIRFEDPEEPHSNESGYYETGEVRELLRNYKDYLNKKVAVSGLYTGDSLYDLENYQNIMIQYLSEEDSVNIRNSIVNCARATIYGTLVTDEYNNIIIQVDNIYYFNPLPDSQKMWDSSVLLNSDTLMSYINYGNPDPYTEYECTVTNAEGMYKSLHVLGTEFRILPLIDGYTDFVTGNTYQVLLRELTYNLDKGYFTAYIIESIQLN